MKISQKSNSNKSNKETQSPMLKIFEDMMHKEKDDPEKANLLKKERPDNRKRKSYSGSHEKCDHCSCESSGTERCPRDTGAAHGARGTHGVQECAYRQQPDPSHSSPYQNEKKESWWFRKDSEKKKTEDTCSCVSCALKKVSWEYVCVACVVVVLTASVVAVVALVSRGGRGAECVAPEPRGTDDEAIRKKIELLKARRQFRSDGAGLHRNWEDVVTSPWGRLPGVAASDFGDSNLLDSGYQDESETQPSGALSQILDADKLSGTHSSQPIRDFYKRLVQTDARINKLKKNLEKTKTYTSADERSMTPISERYKRSLMSVHPAHNGLRRMASDSEDSEIDLNKFYLFFPPFSAVKEYYKRNPITRKVKRSADPTADVEPSGLLIEKKKVMVQYGPLDRKRNFPKCSHTPKESKSYEKQLKHPFYKNSQRLDELLDQLRDKNIEKIISNPFGLDVLEGDRERCKHPKLELEDTTPNDRSLQTQFLTASTGTPEIYVKNSAYKVRSVDSNFETNEDDADYKKQDSDGDDKSDEETFSSYSTTTPRYDIILSVSTLINPESTIQSKVVRENFDIMQSKRKLMQFNEEDGENLGYEDFKEVLADYTENQDEMDKQVEREKRMDDYRLSKEQSVSNGRDAPGVQNPNWKGPMPLYPDEINIMLRQSALQSKIALPAAGKETSAQKDKADDELLDAEYVEDYVYNKYNNLAQAYSDYGVLAGKKESDSNEKNVAVSNKLLKSKAQLLSDKHAVNVNSVDQQADSKLHKESKFEMKQFEMPENKIGHSNIIQKISQHIKIVDEDKAKELSNTDSNDNSYKLQKDKMYVDGLGKRSFLSRRLRSLKSVEEQQPEPNNTEEVNSSTDIISFNSTSEEVRALSENNTDVRNKTENRNSTDLMKNDFYIGPGEVFGAISDWFLNLSKLSGELDDGNSNLTQKTAPKKHLSNQNVTDEIGNINPMFDAEVMEHIAHRSRILLSVNDDHENTTMTTRKLTKITAPSGGNITLPSNLTIASQHETYITEKLLTAEQNLTNVTTLKEIPFSDVASTTEMEPNETKHKSVVKRSVVDDSNLIFWNDIYDDEYGVKTDYFDDVWRDQQPVDRSNFVKRSGEWINKKFKKLENSIRTQYNRRGRRKGTTVGNKRILRSIDGLGGDSHLNKNHQGTFKKRDRKSTEEEEEADNKSNFAALTANMKKIFREAATAVQQTRNIKVREDQQDEVVATSLMQQLVHLMTDLVDYQVQQKTCAKLPKDLEQFLAWLTSPQKEDSNYDPYVVKDDVSPNYDYLNNVETSTYNIFGHESEAPTESDPRSECLSTLLAVQDLLRRYDEMTDADKNTLRKVRAYLEDQLDYLTKRMTEFNERDTLKLYKKRHAPSRFRRDVHKQKHRLHDFSQEKKHRTKRKPGRFVKSPEVKHTKSTPSGIQSAIITDVKIRDNKQGEAVVRAGRNVQPRNHEDVKKRTDNRETNIALKHTQQCANV